MNIGIINYSLGNVGSVYSAFGFYKYNVRVVNRPSDLDSTDIIIMAGVGNFKTAAAKLNEANFWDKLNEEVLVKKKPVLGICLGMQLFADSSLEGGENKGFGWVKGKVVRLPSNSARIPHIGWDEISITEQNMFKGVRYNSFYFMHSFHFIPEDNNLVIGRMKYGDSQVVAAIKKDNIVGVQFHPEKSQGDGLRFLKNFVESMKCYIKE